MSELTPLATLPGQVTVAASINSETKEKENKDREKKSREEQFHEAVKRPKILEDKAARIERLKSGFRICRPQGSFIWPGMVMSPQGVVQLDDHIVVPTPPSASSSTTLAPKLIPIPQPQHVPRPFNSPIKPRAEKRPVTTATLTQVTTMSFPLSDPLKGTPSTENEKPPLINLNEAPPQISDTSFCRTLTYQRTRSARMEHGLTAGKQEANPEKEGKTRHCEEQEIQESSPSSSSLSSQEDGWWQLSLLP